MTRVPVWGLVRLFGQREEAPRPKLYGREEFVKELRIRARRGAKLLDRKIPGWWEQADLGGLDLASCTRCMAGQLFGYYDQGLASLDIWRRGHEFGFSLPSFRSELDPAMAWEELTLIWREIIVERRGERASREAALTEEQAGGKIVDTFGDSEKEREPAAAL